MGSPAPFRRRYAAYSLDAAIVVALAAPLVAWRLRALPAAFDAGIAALQRRMLVLADTGPLPADPWSLALAWSADPPLRARLFDLAAVLGDALLAAAAIVVAVAAAWFVAFEALRQATPGKAALGLRVTDLRGGPPGWRRAALRFVAGAPSWLLLHLGHSMAAWRVDRRALHDLAAGTRVELRDGVDPRLPPWAQAWLWLQAAAVCAAAAVVIGRYAAMASMLGGTG